jgi:hypothetical protein
MITLGLVTAWEQRVMLAFAGTATRLEAPGTAFQKRGDFAEFLSKNGCRKDIFGAMLFLSVFKQPCD